MCSTANNKKARTIPIIRAKGLGVPDVKIVKNARVEKQREH